MDKLNRNYFISIQKAGEPSFLEVELPFTIEFDINQKTLAAVKDSSFRIYNLSKTNRSQVRRDQYDFGTFRAISFNAGYGENRPNIFSGNVLQAWSVREGVDFITQIIAQGGGFGSLNANTSRNFPEGTPIRTVIESLVRSLGVYGISLGKIGNYAGSLYRGNTYNGNTFQLLQQLTGNGFFIYNSKAYCLNDNEAFEGQIPEISPANGLLSTPIRENTYVNLEMIFEPRLQVGQLIELRSLTGDDVNGRYKVLSLRHRGMISPTVCGEAITSVGLSSASGALTLV